jgi:hypothetical protein
LANVSQITTGEQAVTATGAVTGSLSTATLTGDFTVKVRVRGLSAGKALQLAVEDTANATPYSDVTQVAVAQFYGETLADGDTRNWRQYEIPMTRFGVANSALRVNVQQISATPGTVLVDAWLEQ